MRMKTFGAVVCLATSAVLAIPEALTAQTSNLTKQQIESVWRAHLGSFPQDSNEAKGLAQQLEAINAKGQKVIECHYGVPGQIYSYVFWHKSAPDGIRQILKSLRSGEDHPFWTLGVNAIDACPAARETARKLLADSRAGVQSNPALAAAGARPTPGAAPGVLQRGQSAPAQPLGPRPPDLSATVIAEVERHVSRLPIMDREHFFRSGQVGRSHDGPLRYYSGRTMVAYSYLQQVGLNPGSKPRDLSAGLKPPFRDFVSVNCIGRGRDDRCRRITLRSNGRVVPPYFEGRSPPDEGSDVLTQFYRAEDVRGGFEVLSIFERGRPNIEGVSKTFVDNWLLLNLGGQ